VPPACNDRARARELVLRYGWNATAYQILNPGLHLWFSAHGDAVAGYVDFAGMRVVAGAPVCALQRLSDVAREIQSDCEHDGCRPLYFGAGERLERLLGQSRSHHLLRLGAQPVWDAQTWDAVVRQKSSLRAQLHRAANKGVVVRELAPRETAARMLELRDVLDAWLSTRGLPPLHFMTEPDTLDDLQDRRVFVAERERRVVAFLVATPVPARDGWLVEQWPRRADAPNGTTHALVDAAMRAFAADGARFATLGLAPLSDRAGPIGVGEHAWLRALLHWVRAHGRRFYNFRGLDAFKASLAPQWWEPIYAIVPDARVSARALWAVAGAFGGGSPVTLIARAILMGAQRELTRLLSFRTQ
jgi:phosphatidylglycerol lysyltransferase